VQGSNDPAEASDNYFTEETGSWDMDHPMALFSETCNLMELDRAWLTEEFHSETALLLRYFGGQVRRVKDLLEYRGLLAECLRAIKVQELS